MYKTATNLYWPLLTNVGGGTDATPGKLHGFGCLLSPSLVISARHVWREIEHRYSWPVILKNDGLFRCDIVLEDELQDIIILRTVQCMRTCESLAPPSGYPQVARGHPQLGTSAGFITRMTLRDAIKGEQSYTAFSESSVSILLKKADNEPIHFMLSGGLFQKGSSGGPVYTPDGTLIGVIVQSMQFVTDFDHPMPAIITAPVIAPTCVYANRIEELKKGD
ncbi:MAG: trypsin-like peptidase domain-containing protein [Kiritimatiellia bacterium]